MNYCLYKLSFTSPLHAGTGEMAKGLDTARMTLCADTLFSALCHTILKKEGASSMANFCRLAAAGKLLFSDTMPFRKESLYIPKPYIRPSVKIEGDSSADNRKAMKKMAHIPVSSLPAFFASLRGKGEYDAHQNSGEFAYTSVSAKNTIDAAEGAPPYSVGLWHFAGHCGLYFILGFEEECDCDRLSNILTALGSGGVGGKVSAGYGKFVLADDPIFLDSPFDDDTNILSKMLSDEKADIHISLTTSLPADGELDEALEGASYGVTRRGGFVYSENFSERLVKKQTQYFLSAGSTFTRRYSGELFNVARNGKHPVFRYGKPIFLGAERL